MDSSDQLNQVELLAEEYLERQQRGEKPTIREYCERHPDLAEEIRDVFEAVAMVEELKPDSHDASGTYGTSLQTATKPLRQIGDYRILREIGRGGMGVVYEAEQESLRRRVALKVLPRQAADNENSRQRFQQEARAAARMHHTNIVPVFEVGQEDEHVFYAMQLIQGQGLDLVIGDLRQIRSERAGKGSTKDTPIESSDSAPQRSLAASLVAGRFERQNLAASNAEANDSQAGSSDEVSDKDQALTQTAAFTGSPTSSAKLPGHSEISTADSNRIAYFRSVAEIGLQTAQALAYAHARGIIHRDIKPSNLLLDAAGIVWVTDFGLAKTSDSAMTQTGDILGTLRYMSPERFKGRCDVRADIFSLGLTLYELLVLKPAFESPDRVKLIDMMVNQEATPPRSIDTRIPRDLETIVLKAGEKDPRRRYQSADDLVDDLQRFINDEPILARRVTLIERVSRWSRRNKPLATASATLILMVVALIGSLAMILKSKSDMVTIEKQSNDSLTEANNELNETLRQKNDLLEDREKQRKAAADLAAVNRQQSYDSDMQALLAKLKDPHSTKEELWNLLDFHNQDNEGKPRGEDLRDHRFYYIKSRLENSSSATIVPDGESGGEPISVAFGRNATVLSLSTTGQLYHWGESLTEPLRTFDLGKNLDVRYTLLSPGGRYAALTTHDGWLHLYDTSFQSSTKPVALWKHNAGGFVMEMQFLQKGDQSMRLAFFASGRFEEMPRLQRHTFPQPERKLGHRIGTFFDNRLTEDVQVSYQQDGRTYSFELKPGESKRWWGRAGSMFTVRKVSNGAPVGVYFANKYSGLASIDADPPQQRETPNPGSLTFGQLQVQMLNLASLKLVSHPLQQEFSERQHYFTFLLLLQWQIDHASFSTGVHRQPLAAKTAKLRLFNDGNSVADLNNRDITLMDGTSRRTIGVTWTSSQLAVSTKYQTIACCSDSGHLRLVDITNSKVIHQSKEHAGEVTAIEYSHDERLLATGGVDGILRIYDVSSPHQPILKKSFKAHTTAIVSICFDRNGDRLISTSDNRELRVWDLRKRHDRIQLDGEFHWGVAISPDGRLLAAASETGCSIWNLNPLYRRAI